jgi:sirohydrochlorin cobaltochelatase
MDNLADLVRTQLGTEDALWTPNYREVSSSQESNALQKQKGDRVVLVSSSWHPLVGTAALELAPLPLHQQICEFGSQALTSGCSRLQLLPLFLLPGVHVMEDIPAEVATAQEQLGNTIKLNLRPHLGAHPGLKPLLANQINLEASAALVLLSHGSRRPGSNTPVEAVAEYLGGVAAYWSVSPSLEEQITALAEAGQQRIAILPYFLFAGGITDAIAQTVAELQAQFPHLQLSLHEPIGASMELANLVVDLTEV